MIMGEKLKNLVDDFDRATKIKHVAVKEVVLPFDKLRIDPILGPEMRSTGESMGLDENFGNAYYKATYGAGIILPKSGKIVVSAGDDKDKKKLAKLCKELEGIGYEILATEGTQQVLLAGGVHATEIKKVSEGSPNTVDLIEGKRVSLVINIPRRGGESLDDDRAIRSKILDYDMPYVTTITGATAAVSAMKSLQKGKMVTKSLNEYFASESS